MRNNIDLLKQACANSLGKLRHHFEGDIRLTLIAHKPGNPEAEFILSDDDLKELREILNRSRTRREILVYPKRGLEVKAPHQEEADG